MAGGRFLSAGIVFVALAVYQGAARPTAYHWLTTGVVGLLMAAGGNGLVSWALQRVPSGLGALLISMVPFWVTLADWLRPRGARPPGQVIALLGLAIGFTGVALLVNPSDIAGGEFALDSTRLARARLSWPVSCGQPAPRARRLSSRYAPQPGFALAVGQSAVACRCWAWWAPFYADGDIGRVRRVRRARLVHCVNEPRFGAWIYVAAFKDRSPTAPTCGC